VIEWPIRSHLNRFVEILQSAFVVLQAQLDVASVVDTVCISGVQQEELIVILECFFVLLEILLTTSHSEIGIRIFRILLSCFLVQFESFLVVLLLHLKVVGFLIQVFCGLIGFGH
jgi:hypothetical protein